MKLALKPVTQFGKRSAVLSFAFIILITLKILFSLPVSTFFIAGLGLAGFIFGILALFKKDVAILTLLSVLVGLVIILWIAAEIIYPH